MTATLTHCEPAERVTRSLLGYGAIAGPLYVTVSVLQGLTRDGFDFGRHPWSLLANGPYGWIQTANLLLTGAMVVVFAVGLHRAGAGRAAAGLVGAFGLGMIGGGLFRADPAMGFPAGTPDGPGEVSWHGTLHFLTSGVGFLCLVVACFLLARRFAAAYSRATGIILLAGFGVIASGGGAVWATFTFIAAIVWVLTWMSALAVHEYRH